MSGRNLLPPEDVIGDCKSSNFLETNCADSFIHVSVRTIVLQLMDFYHRPRYDLGSLVYHAGHKGRSDWGRHPADSSIVSGLDEMDDVKNLLLGAPEPTVQTSREDFCVDTSHPEDCRKSVEAICPNPMFCYVGMEETFRTSEVG